MLIDIVVRLRHHDIARIPRIDLRARRALIRQRPQVHRCHVEKPLWALWGRETRLAHQIEYVISA